MQYWGVFCLQQAGYTLAAANRTGSFIAHQTAPSIQSRICL